MRGRVDDPPGLVAGKADLGRPPLMRLKVGAANGDCCGSGEDAESKFRV